MQRADLTTRAVAGFVDLLIIMGLSRLPDILGFLFASGYILIRDGLFDRRSVGKKLIGLRVTASDEAAPEATYRESIIRNAPFAIAYLLFLIPYAGWILGPVTVGLECLAALGDERGMRVGDLLARTLVVPDAPASARAQRPTDRQTGASPAPAAEEPHDAGKI
ncbi:MAG: RDD family protein [Nitrospirota bacterium]